MKEVRYNSELFKIENYEDGYKNYLVFLIRYFFSSKDFSGIITKKDFIEKGINRGFSQRNLENIYQKGKLDNTFIREIKKKNRNQFIALKSLFDKEKYSNNLVYIEEFILERITDINSFRSLCYIIRACRPLKADFGIKKKEYFYKNPSRLIGTIGKDFGGTEKSTMSKRLTKAKELFPDIFNITNRYTYFNGFMVQISNLYSIEGVRYINKRDNRKQLKEYDKNIKQKDTFKIKNKYIRSKKEIFGEKPEKYKGFLNEDLYEHLYLKIKEEVFK